MYFQYMTIHMYMHLEAETFPMTHDKENVIDRLLGTHRNLVYLPDRVVYKQTTK